MQQHRVVAGSAFPAGAVPGRQIGPQGGQFCTHGGTGDARGSAAPGNVRAGGSGERPEGAGA